MIRTILVAAGLAVAPAAFGAAPALAQQAQPALTAEAFVRQAALSNLLEIRSSELALESADGADVRAFAERMIEDHTAATERLAAAAGELPLPQELDATHEAMLEPLRGATGSQFDRAYLELQVQAHQRSVDLFQTYAQGGDDPELRSFAQETLPTLQQHLEEAQAIAGQRT